MSTRVVGVRAAWGIVRPHPPHDHPDIPVPGHPAPSHPQALVLRYWWQAPALDQGEVELLVSVQQVLFASAQGYHAIGFAG
jgi:hypothetical protein